MALFEYNRRKYTAHRAQSGKASMIVTTTPSVEGMKIVEYRVWFSAKLSPAWISSRIFPPESRTFSAAARAPMRGELIDARTAAVNEMVERATRAGAECGDRRRRRLRGSRSGEQHADGDRVGYGRRNRLIMAVRVLIRRVRPAIVFCLGAAVLMTALTAVVLEKPRYRDVSGGRFSGDGGGRGRSGDRVDKRRPHKCM